MMDLEEIFKGLNSYYENKGSMEQEKHGFNMDGTLPVSISELDTLHIMLAELDGQDKVSPYASRDGTKAATIVDVTHIFDMLVIHFEGAKGPNDPCDLDPKIKFELSKLFNKMSDYYGIEQMLDWEQSEDLWFIYDSLEDEFLEGAEEHKGEKDDDDDDDFDDDDELDEVLDDLANVDKGDEELDLPLLVESLQDLVEFYNEENTDTSIDIPELTIGDFKPVFKHLAKLDGTLGSPFEQREDDEMAKIADLMHILDKMSKHYSSEAKTGGFREDWADEEDRRKIGKIFKEMADFYLIFDTIEKREKD